MCKRWFRVVACVTVSVAFYVHPLSSIVAGQSARPPQELQPTKVAAPPVIDGALDDDAWKGSPLQLGDWLSYNPAPGDRIPQRTEVWIAYDDRALYLAFRCTDPEPDRVKTGIRRRDGLFNDDWVGFSLDSLGTRQTTYDMFINPSGMQADILTSSASGEDVAPDWVWESDGRTTPTGYEVEVRVPFQSIRFRGGAELRMGILFWRRVSRLGVSVSWPDLPPGRSIFERHATLVLTDVPDRRPKEAIPSITYVLSEARETPSHFRVEESEPAFGLTGKLGVTSSTTLDATLNPDFSQVESDAFQVEVNQRFPLFFSEKRPFFFEGRDIFALAGPGGDNNLITAVHTRRIVDPIFGLKLPGTAGRFAFGGLSAVDEAPGRALSGQVNPHEGKDKIFNIARMKYTLGPANYVGAIATHTAFAGRHNRVAGGDFSVRLNDRQRLNGMLMYSSTSAFDGSTGRDGVAGHVQYGYGSRRVNAAAFAEHFDEGFEMDTAFYNRTGITSGWVYSDYSFYPDRKRHGWVRRVTPFVFAQGGADRVARGHDRLVVPGVRASFTRQGFLRVDALLGAEPWAGRQFDLNRRRVFGSVQLFRWLSVDGQLSGGDATFYDPIDPFQGKLAAYRLGGSFQPTPQITQSISYSYNRFTRASTGEEIFVVHLVNTRSVYQFTKEFFLRAIIQFDSRRTRVLIDTLASYELRPGTVIYGGYGSLLEEQLFSNGEWISGEGAYQTTRRGLFLKASYLYRF
jgi:hypothetical protein